MYLYLKKYPHNFTYQKKSDRFAATDLARSRLDQLLLWLRLTLVEAASSAVSAELLAISGVDRALETMHAQG